MKKSIIAFVLIFSVMLTVSHPFAENVQEEMCTIKWVSRGASFALNRDKNTLYQIAYSKVPKGTVLTIDDLPDVQYDENGINAKNCHAEWKGAVGSKIEEDCVFNLQWIANSPDEVVVAWNSYLKKIAKAKYCVKLTTFEKGYVITENDLPKLKFDESDDYEFGWGYAVGTELTDSTFFDVRCTPKSPDMVTVCYHLPQRDCMFAENIPDDYDYSSDNGEETIVRLYPKGGTIEEMPDVFKLIAPGSLYDTTDVFEYDFTGITAENNLTNCYVQIPALYSDVTFMLDKDTVYKEYINVKRTEALIAPSCDEYAQVVNLDEEYTLAVWKQGQYPVGSYPWEVDPSDEFYPLFKPTFYYPVVYKYGDVSYDGEINTRDATILLKYCANMWYSTRLYKPVADANKDGSVNTADAVEILRKVAGISAGQR